MLALPDPNGQAEVSRPSTGVIPSSIGHEENTTEDSTDSGRSGVPIDYDLARVPSVELPPLPSVTAFNRDLDIEHSQDIHEEISQGHLPVSNGARNPSYEDLAPASNNIQTTHPPNPPLQTPPQTPPALSSDHPFPFHPKSPTTTSNQPPHPPTPPHATTTTPSPESHLRSPPPAGQRSSHPRRRFVRWVKKKFGGPWSADSPHSERERNRVLRWIKGQGL